MEVMITPKSTYLIVGIIEIHFNLELIYNIVYKRVANTSEWRAPPTLRTSLL
jgi:hypothetical protein